MLKTYLNENLEPLSKEEERTGRASYRRVLKIYSNDIVLCNDIIDIDESVLYNMDISQMCEYSEDEDGEQYPEIYQYYLCNLDDFQRNNLKARGVILSYSDMLDLDIICVDHWGTSWDYVLTDSELTNNLNEI